MEDLSTVEIDRLLTDAFDRALDSADQTDVMLERIMTRIRVHQRRRFILMTVIGLAAMLIVLTNGLPLVGLALEALGSVKPADWSTQLPTILVGAVVVFGSVAFIHMLVEEPI